MEVENGGGGVGDGGGCDGGGGHGGGGGAERGELEVVVRVVERWVDVVTGV